MEKILQKITRELERKKLDTFLVSHPANITYLTGFSPGSIPSERISFLVVCKDKMTLIVPRLYQKEARRCKTRLWNLKIVSERKSFFRVLKKYLSQKRIGIEKDDLRVLEFEKLKSISKKVVKFPDIIEKFRMRKNPDEIVKIQEAIKVTKEALKRAFNALSLGIKEYEIREQIRRFFFENGCEEAFDSVIAFGKNSACPHYQTGNKELRKGDIVLVDCGAKFQNYSADITKTVVYGSSSKEIQRMFSLVQKTKIAAIKKCRPKVSCGELYKAAYRVFQENSVHQNFLHALGHGIGIQVHERPTLFRGVREVLEPGMVITIEPGLYDEKIGGVRIEDDILITKDGCEILSE